MNQKPPSAWPDPRIAAGALLVLLVCGVLLGVSPGGPVAVPTSEHGGPGACRGYRWDDHPDGSIASCEVTLSIRSVEVVRRAVFSVDGRLDEPASGLFRRGVKERDLNVQEIEDLRMVGRERSGLLGKELPASLLAED
jgi:hypothetical protein